MIEVTQKQALTLFSEYLDNVRKSTALHTSETEAQKRKRITRLEASPEEWFKYYFPDEASAEPAKFHIAATKRVLSRPEWYEVRMWSRELAKSTRTMLETIYLVMTGQKHFVLLISNSYDNAERLLMPYRAHLEGNHKLINDYGVQELPGSWTSGEFITRDGNVFRAVGMGQQPRGAKWAGRRPDVLLFDDVDTDIDCRNPETVNNNWHWIEDAAIGTRSISNPMLIIFCGNRIAADCCVERATKFCDHHDEVNIRDKDGNSTWPSKNKETHIERILKQKSYASVQKEYFNNPIQEGAVFDQMAYKSARPLSEYTYLVCYTDPSFKDTKKNDYKGTVLVGKWRDEFHVIKCYLEQTTTAKMIEWHYAIMNFIGARSCYYYMEKVFISDLILKEFYTTSAITGRTIPIQGDDRAKDDKYTRIETLLQPLHTNGKLYFNADEADNPHMMRLDEQFRALGPKSRAHDDGPDAVEGAVWIINNKELAAVCGIETIKRKKSSKHF